MILSLDPVDPATVGMSADRLRHAADLMHRQYDEGKSPMLVAVVARHGQVVFAEAIGDHRPGGPPLTLDSVFPLASQSKPMTAATLMCLVERGMVGLNEPVTRHLPELEGRGNGEVMVHHLLTHTSGWSDEDTQPAVDAHVDDSVASWNGEGDVLTHILMAPCWDVPRRQKAGTLMQYCNFNYSMIGGIIRRATGGTLDAAMREYLFDPIGMTGSAVIVPEDLAPRVIERPAGIAYGPDHPHSPISFNDPLWAACDDGAGGVHAPPVDCLRFAQMLLDGGTVGDTRVLSRDAVRVMTTDQIPGIRAEAIGGEYAEASWGYGNAVSSHVPWPKFSGGTLAPGSIRHAGAGGINVWTDPSLDLVGVYFEMVTEVDEFNVPLYWASHRFEDVVTASVTD